jgi:hypothetical protein
MLESYHLSGRFGNRFFQNLVIDMLSRKFNLPARYEYFNECTALGFDLFTNGTNIYEDTRMVNDINILRLLDMDSINVNLILQKHDTYFQCPEIAKRIRMNLDTRKIKERNSQSVRYGNNMDMFVHVRLGDLKNTSFVPPIEYYDSVLQSISFSNGYIASDTIDHPIVQRLISKYSLKPFIDNEINTIQFGSTCKYIVTAGGTFSWLIALLGLDSDVYYPKDYLKWHGDIYGFPDWKGT